MMSRSDWHRGGLARRVMASTEVVRAALAWQQIDAVEVMVQRATLTKHSAFLKPYPASTNPVPARPLTKQSRHTSASATCPPDPSSSKIGTRPPPYHTRQTPATTPPHTAPRVPHRPLTCRAPAALPAPMSRAMSDCAATASASASSPHASHSCGSAVRHAMWRGGVRHGAALCGMRALRRRTREETSWEKDTKQEHGRGQADARK